MERFWKKQSMAVPINRSTYRAMVGNFQRQICWDSAGHVYIITAEDDGMTTTSRIAIYRSVNAGFDIAGGFTFQADTRVANGYPNNEILGLTEFSAQLRNNKIFIANTFNDPPLVLSGVEIIAYDINTKSFERIDYMNCFGGGTTPFINSVDISVAPRRAHGDIIASWLEYNDMITPSMLVRRYLREVLATTSLTGTGGTGSSDLAINMLPMLYPCFLSNFDGDSELWGVQKTQISVSESRFTLANLPRELLRGSSLGPIDIFLGSSNSEQFGHFKAVYNPKYNIEILVTWRVLPEPQAGWRLDFGVRGQNGVFESFKIAEFDYSNLGVSNVLVDIPNVHPEALVIVDDQGGTHVIASFPSPSSRPLTGAAGAGRIDAPYYNIAMAYWADDDFDDLDGINYEAVWNGGLTGTMMRYLSAPDMVPAGDSNTMRATKLFFTCVDTLNDPNGQVVIYRD